MSDSESSVGMLPTTDGLQDGEMGQKFKDNCLRITSPVSPVKFYCCYVVIMVLAVAIVALSVALSVRKTEPVPMETAYAVCPRDWIGFGNKCFYFSEYTSNWTFSQDSCMALEAQLARFDNMEELNFLRRYKGTFDYWIGLHRESLEDPWIWTDSTAYNNLLPIRGVEKHAYLNSNAIKSARIYADRRWICSKTNSYTLKCQNPI
ncbi:C-type lectin domain family 2 member D11-like [Acomys russatus]|uniref:C-type lectin domain family 2 member D11-like n=1 Tax=Acomys russatus TaxID=60746 RepID=UPI0021E2C5D9|nr:C-type lectin domain family 2 member D11-like [Acomys russatus]